MKKVCCICGMEFKEFGNNPYPIKDKDSGRCCDWCNTHLVVPLRQKIAENTRETEEK